MQEGQPCKIELKWPACCPRCGLDLRVSPVISANVERAEPVSPATIVLKELAKRWGPKTASQEKPTENVEEQIDLVMAQPAKRPADLPEASETVKPDTLPRMERVEITSKVEAKMPPSTTAFVPVPPPLPAEELKQETPPPPPPNPAPEPDVISKPESTPAATIAPGLGQSMSQYYGLLPMPTQVTFPAPPQPIPSPVQYGQITLNPPPMIVQQQPVWTPQPPAQQQQVQFSPCYQTATWYRQAPPPAVIVQQQQRPQQVVPPPSYVQFSAPPPVSFPFPPPTMGVPFQQQQQPQQLPGPGQAPMVPGNGVFTVQHHYLNVLPGQFQQ